MPTAKYFGGCPEFPSDVVVADIPTISYNRLRQSDTGEGQKLFQACREYGFFLIDLSDSLKGQALIGDAESMFDLTNETLDLDQETLDKYEYRAPKNLEGYKAEGKLKTDEGKLDVTEMYMYGQDEMLGRIEPGDHPHTVNARKEQCKDFCLGAHEVVAAILNALDSPLGLPKGTLSSLCPLDKTSGTGVRMLRTIPKKLMTDQNITLGAHTDIGTVSVLFNVVGGLQILPGTRENIDQNWLYVRPKPGCAIVNLGDTLVEWTGGVLRSCLHRVHNPPGTQAYMVRQSLVYAVRPAHDGSMSRLKGSDVIPALAEGEEDTSMSVDDWATWRAGEIIQGRLKAQTIGGIPIEGEA